MLKLVLKLKTVLFLLASDFPTENPSNQKRTILIPNVANNYEKPTANNIITTFKSDF